MDSKGGIGLDLLERLEERDREEAAERAVSGVRRKRRISFFAVAAVCLFFLVAGILYVNSERIIYYWDDSTYWDICRDIVSGKMSPGFWKNVYDSIGSSDYNYVAALPSAAWMYVFGISREAFVAGLVCMYVIPSILLMHHLARKLSKAPAFAFGAAVFIMPVTMFLAFNGFVDVGGMLIALACYNLYYTRDGTAKSWYRYVAIGALLVLIMVFRRYFAFFSISFLTAMVIDCILFKAKWRNLIITCLVSGLLLVTVLMPFLTGILLKDYGTLYSGYKYPVMTDIKLITRYFGAIFIAALFVVPFVAALRKHEYRPIFLWIQVLVCAVTFILTQTHGQQHLLLYVPAFALLTMFMVNCISKQWMLIALCLVTAANFFSVFIDREQPGNIQEIKTVSLIPTFSMKPDSREDTQQILDLKRDLDKVIPEGSTCNVLASSFVLNDSILRNAEPSLNAGVTREPDYIRSLPEVDSRDYGRLDEIYNAEYILVAFPSQTHLAPGEQTIVDEAVSSFDANMDIATAFEEVSGFSRSIDDMTVKLFRRTEDIMPYQKILYESRLYY